MSVFVLALASGLRALGHEVDIFTKRTNPDAPRTITLQPGVHVRHVAVEGAEDLSKEGLLACADDFVEEIERMRAGVRYDVIHSHYWISGVVGAALSARWGCPHLVTFHTLGAAKQAARVGHKEPPGRLSRESLLARTCDGVIVPTETERALLNTHCGPELAPVYVVPCGVDKTRFACSAPRDAPRRDAWGEHRGARLLFVGRLDAMKGLETLLDSMALLPASLDALLVIVGGGDGDGLERQQLVRGIAARAISARVQLRGAVPPEKMPTLYRRADVVVVSSRYESFGLVILEALACGTLVVSTPVGVAPDVIEVGVNGHLAQVDDAHGLAEAIAEALPRSRTQRPEAIRDTVSGYSWRSMASATAEIYRNSMSRASVQRGQ